MVAFERVDCARELIGKTFKELGFNEREGEMFGDFRKSEVKLFRIDSEFGLCLIGRGLWGSGDLGCHVSGVRKHKAKANGTYLWAVGLSPPRRGWCW